MRVEAIGGSQTQASVEKLQRGFTLVELVVVIAVLAALAMIALPELGRILRDVSKVDVQTQARALQTRNEINAIGCSSNAVSCISISSSGDKACEKGLETFLTKDFWENEFKNGDYEVTNIDSDVVDKDDREQKRLDMIENGLITEASAIFTVTRDYDALLEKNGSSWFNNWNIEQPCILYAE